MRTFRLSPRTLTIAGLGTAATALMTAAFLLQVGGETGVMWISDIGEPAIVLISAAIVIRTGWLLGPRTLGLPWLLIGLGVAAFGLGDVVWSIIELGQGIEVPYPGLPDVFYILLYPLVAAGLLIAIAAYRRLVDVRGAAVTGAVFALGVSVALYFGFLQPLVLSQATSAGEAALNVFYPIADVVFALGPAIVIALIVSKLGQGRLAWPWWAVVVGVIAFALGDLGYSYLSARDLYASGNLVDAAWSLAAAAIAVGASIVHDLAQPERWTQT